MTTNDFLKSLPPEDNISVEGIPTREAIPAFPHKGKLGRFTESHGLTVRDVTRLLFKHKWAITLPLILCASVGVTYTFLATPWYEATATIQIQPNELAALAPTVSLERQRNLLMDQVQVLRSDTMLERVVEVLRLDTRMAALLAEDIQAVDRVTAAIHVLKMNILAIQAIQDTNFITITATLSSADLSATIPNTLAEEYVNAMKDRISTTATQLSGRYDDEAKATQQELENIETRISQFLTNKGIPDITQKFTSLQLQADRMETELREAKREEKRLSKNIEALEAQLKKEPPTISSTTQVASNPQYLQVKQYLDQLQLQRTSMAGTWKQGSKRIQALDQQIEETQKALEELDPETVVAKVSVVNPRHDQILDELVRYRPLLEATREDINSLTESSQEITNQLNEFASIRREYMDMMNEKTRVQSELEFSQEKAKQAQTTGKFANEIAEVRISDQARKPLRPSGPNHVLHVVLSIMAGLGLGIGFTVMREALSHAVETAQDVQRYLGVTVLGSVPEKAFGKRSLR
jgi:uncharacterized protein involved in exopolysaccharide biosynthesis